MVFQGIKHNVRCTLVNQLKLQFHPIIVAAIAFDFTMQSDNQRPLTHAGAGLLRQDS